jgi:hypothetical protein
VHHIDGGTLPPYIRFRGADTIDMVQNGQGNDATMSDVVTQSGRM